MKRAPEAFRLACSAPPIRYRDASAVARNPLVVQFWLLGIDAARGDLRSRGFVRQAAPLGSSVYTLGDLSLHSKGLWLRAPWGTLHYLRPRESFYQLPPTLDCSLERSWRPPPGARTLQRFEGLAAVQAHFLEHEAWVARRRGLEYRAGLLSGKLPPKVRQLVPAWEAWAARQVDLRNWN